MKKFMHFLSSAETSQNYQGKTRPPIGTISSPSSLETVDQIDLTRNEVNGTQEYSNMKSIRHYPVSKPRAVTRWYDLVEETDYDMSLDGGIRSYDLDEPSFTLQKLNPP